MNFLHQGFRKLLPDGHTDKHTDATKITHHTALWVVKNTTDNNKSQITITVVLVSAVSNSSSSQLYAAYLYTVHYSSAALLANKGVFSQFLKCPIDQLGFQNEDGRPFHNHGLAAVKLHSRSQTDKDG